MFQQGIFFQINSALPACGLYSLNRSSQRYNFFYRINTEGQYGILGSVHMQAREEKKIKRKKAFAVKPGKSKYLQNLWILFRDKWVDRRLPCLLILALGIEGQTRLRGWYGEVQHRLRDVDWIGWDGYSLSPAQFHLIVHEFHTLVVWEEEAASTIIEKEQQDHIARSSRIAEQPTLTSCNQEDFRQGLGSTVCKSYLSSVDSEKNSWLTAKHTIDKVFKLRSFTSDSQSSFVS